MKRVFLSLVTTFSIIGILCLTVLLGISGNDDMERNAKSKSHLDFKVELLNDRQETKNANVPLVFTFTNNSPNKERIFADFDPIFHYIRLTIKDEFGEYFNSLIGKIDLGPGPHRYVELRQDDFFGFRANIDVFKTGVTFKPGKYEITVKYYNQYGTDCFKGTLESKIGLEFNEIPNSDKLIVTSFVFIETE